MRVSTNPMKRRIPIMSRIPDKEKLLMVIDGSNLAHRAFEKFKNLKSRNETPTGMVYGFMRLLNQYVIRFHPTFVLVTFDTSKSKSSNYKLKLLGEYKEHRKRLNIDYESFNMQLETVKKMVKYLGISYIWDSKGLGHESDDYIAYYSKRHSGKVLIISSDKDFCQLISSRIKIFNPFKEVIIRKENCSEIMGYSPEECVDYLSLVGDKSDDIPGYIGIGPVKARKFLDQFGSIKAFLDNEKAEFPGIDRDGLKYLAKKNEKLINLDYAITRINKKGIKPPLYSVKEIDKDKLRNEFKKLTLRSFCNSQFLSTFERLKSFKYVAL